jgi:hypothetical protein
MSLKVFQVPERVRGREHRGEERDRERPSCGRSLRHVGEGIDAEERAQVLQERRHAESRTSPRPRHVRALQHGAEQIEAEEPMPQRPTTPANASSMPTMAL